MVDDVRAGFRLHEAGSWELVGVRPDLSSWSKAISNGHALAALTGNDRFRQAASDVFSTGSFWTAAVAMAASLATIRTLLAGDAVAQVTAALGGPARHVLDLVGSPQTAALGFDSLGRGAMLVMVGLFGGAAPWPLPLVPIKAATIIGSYVGNLGELRELVELVRGKNVQPINVTCCPLHDANRALSELRSGKLIGRAVLVPERRPSFSAA